MDWKTEKYTLTRPLDEKRLGEGAEPLTELVFEEPDGEMLEAIDEIGIQPGVNPSITQSIKLISAMSGEPYHRTKKMHHVDIMGAIEKTGPLLGDLAGD